MILRCPNCYFGNHDTQKVCHKCKTALPPVRVEDFVGHARYLAFDARQHLAHAYFMKRMKKENDDALEIHKYAEMLETVDKGLEKFDVPNAPGERTLPAGEKL